MTDVNEILGLMILLGAAIGVAVTAVLVGAIVLDVVRHGRRK